MYVFHKPTDHETWLAYKTSLNAQRGKGDKDKAATLAPAPLVSLTINLTKSGRAAAVPWET